MDFSAADGLCLEFYLEPLFEVFVCIVIPVYFGHFGVDGGGWVDWFLFYYG